MAILAGRHIKVSPQCPICKSGPEDIGHILFGCLRAKETWSELGLMDDIQHALLVDRSGSVVLEHILRSPNRDAPNLERVSLHELIAVGGWYIWWQRREAVKGERVSPPKNSTFAIKALTANFGASQGKAKEKEFKWVKPMKDKLKLNIDASYFADGSGAAGGVLRNEKGEVMAGYYCTLKQQSRSRSLDRITDRLSLYNHHSSTLSSSHCSRSPIEHHPDRQNGAPPAGPRAPRRLQRRAAAADAAASNSKRAASPQRAGSAQRTPGAGSNRATRREPSSRPHRAPGRQPASSSHRSSGASHASSGATGPGHAPSDASGPCHAPSRAAVPCHPSPRSHHAAGHPTTRSHNPAPGSPDPAPACSYHPASRAHHPAAITAHVATARHASSNGDTTSSHDAHHRPNHRPGDVPSLDALALPGQPQGALPRRRDVPDIVPHARASWHTGDRQQQRHHSARRRCRRVRCVGDRGPRRLPLSSS
ncbi:LOW QUALITY PROTEIN: histidine-rich protein PFHRP-II-like [Lolium rigidum]|uniref:LOW QUALITY PROTEIN: histidine-rich protein PFHRP-II-like n=1 Tax=Lolium rigidum TaxID=89674 RepID=UPI001F5CD9FB|nr:LOW QUALITY PROTEIN: histidine-rich protein PFHRP-II-like [Lolium rigidum]